MFHALAATGCHSIAMLLPSETPHDASLILIEGGLTTIAVAASFAWPRLCSSWFAHIERAFTRLARRRKLAVIASGLSAPLLRLTLLPLFPIPLPFVPDDFSFLLAADTFVHGRLANPAPALWPFFESIQLTVHPTYQSMYFPLHGLVLAAGQVLFGNPWFAILAVDALFCAALCWMLQAWLPPTWALLGALIAVVRIGLFSYWIDTIAGGSGMLAALGGALVLGALPRLTRTARMRYGVLMAVGIAILGLTRPYEGVLLCLPVAVALGRWIWKGKNRPSSATLVRRAALPLAIVVAAVAWLGYYDFRAFGKATTLPYTVDRAEYAMAPYYIWQSPRPQPHYRDDALRQFYVNNEFKAYQEIHSWSGYLPMTFLKIVRGVFFFAGFALIPPLVMCRRVLRDRRVRFLVVCMCVLMAGMAIEIFLIPHYLAVFTAVFYALGLQATRHLYAWAPNRAPVGKTMVRLTIALCVVLGGIRSFAGPLHLQVNEWPASGWSGSWIGPEHFGLERAQMQTKLDGLPGRQLVLVRYLPGHEPIDEWVYNLSDIEDSKVVWARDMGAADNLELLHYYPHRKAWLVEPDTAPATLVPYPMPKQSSPGSH
ncbi:MAG: hypothetical protein ACRD3N_03735 [Terracidiphilus sp.]